VSANSDENTEIQTGYYGFIVRKKKIVDWKLEVKAGDVQTHRVEKLRICGWWEIEKEVAVAVIYLEDNEYQNKMNQ
jgi:hypothetical protein